ncbi:sensor histidine kinase [Desertibacillus haloalkaliphilus]|uniref:sensor histidine kinase n=1 Tax=Desertibacillus haloalkaliphilus TaxID=1328930 RepID=UPI001C264BF4|nr:sensor histidine kinase [Desertibacillus haloalkaliphilus]MBU8907542.1 HAMP domain-containing protein [Desertibacillus haloalkaliphilus]
MSKRTIEKKILLPFLLVVILPILASGLSSYWTVSNAYQQQMFLATEQTIDSWFSIQERIRGYRDDGRINNDDYEELLGELQVEVGDLQPLTPISAEQEVRPDGWTRLDDTLIGKQHWVYVVTDPFTSIQYEYPIELSVWTEAMQEVQKYTVLVVIIASIIAVQLTIILSHHIAKPIRKLAEFCRSIGEGGTTLPPEHVYQGRRDEIEILGESLKEMIESLEQKNDSLKQMKDFQERLLNGTLLGIYTITLDGQILLKNEKWKRIETSVPTFQDKVDRWLKDPHQESEVQEQWQLESTNGRKDLLVKKVPLEDSEGSIVALLCTVEDITSVKRIETKIETINRLTSLGRLSAQIAHEIRNPLAGMKTTSQVLKKRLTLDEKERQLFNMIETEIDRLNKTITKMLVFSRPREANREIVAFMDVFRESNRLIEQARRSKGISVIERIDPAVTVYIDRDHLKQILLNVLINATKAVDAGGRMEVKAYDNGPYTFVEVTDNGSGITKEDLPKLFDPFFTTDTKGTGLGLAVVQQLVLQNDGEVKVESNPGEGTTFTLIFLRNEGKEVGAENSND